MMPGAREVQYLVLPDAANPYLLARVRWPDVCQAISPVRPDWQDDPGLFDLPYDSNSIPVTRDHAAAIAAQWDARLPADVPVGTFEFPIVRRMPADWSNLSRAERRAWSIDAMDTRPLVATGNTFASGQSVPAASRQVARARRPWRRRRDALVLTDDNSNVVVNSTVRDDARVTDGVQWLDAPGNETGDIVIDLTDTTEDVPTPVDDR